MKWDILFEFIWRSMEIETKTWSECLSGGKTLPEQILASEKINKLEKRAGLWDSLSEIQKGKLIIWIRSF